MSRIVGAGLRHNHFPVIENLDTTNIEWFEIISENFMYTRGRPFEILLKLRERFPISTHGVSLSIGSTSPLDQNYLDKLKELINIIDPFLVSDHLCWTGEESNNLHNLLPLPYNDETLNYLCSRINQVQDFLQRPIAIENLSAYFSLKDSTYTEWDFLNTLAKKSGCKILLDINNIYVNSVNQSFNPEDYLDAIDNEQIAQIHLAGFSQMDGFLFDTHSKPVCDEVWQLYKKKIQMLSHVPTLIEWDEDIPDFSILEKEVLKAQTIIKEHCEKA